MQSTKRQTVHHYDVLPPERQSRPNAARAPMRPVQVEDAVFEVIPARRPSFQRVNDNPRPLRPQPKGGFLPFAARLVGKLALKIEHGLSHLSTQTFVTLLVSMVVIMFWICGGFSALATTKPVLDPARPFTVNDLRIDRQDANGMKVAVVYGAVSNMSTKARPAPRLKVMAGQGGRIIGTLNLPVTTIWPGESVRFTGRFNLGGGKSDDITVFAAQP